MRTESPHEGSIPQTNRVLFAVAAPLKGRVDVKFLRQFHMVHRGFVQITIESDRRQGTVIASNNVKNVDCRGDCAVFGDVLKTIIKFPVAILLADLIAQH